MEKPVDPETFANRTIRRIALAHGGTATDGIVRRVVDEMLELCPGLRQHFSDALLTELKEEIARREDPRFSRATITLIETIEDEWRNTE